MEIARNWRLISERTGFRTGVVEGQNGPSVLRYPGGELPLVGTYEQIYERLVQKGFGEEVAEEILLACFGSVSTEPPVSEREIVDGLFKFLRSEIGEQDRSEIELRVN